MRGMPSFLSKHRSLFLAGILFFMMLCVTSPVIWHSDNLTFCHALYQNDAPSPHWLYPSYLLSYPLCFLSEVIPFVNVYLLYLYGLLIGSAAAVLHVSRAQSNGITSTVGLVGFLLACYIIFFIPQHMEYAWISFLAAGCGCMLIFNSLYREKPDRKDLIFGVALFFGGIILRHDSCLGCAPFIGVASLFLLKPKSGFQCRPCFINRRLIVPVLCLLGIVFTALFQRYPAQGAYNGGNLVDINATRMSFYDYGDRSGIDKTQEYAACGIDQASVRLLRAYLFEDPDVQTPEWWSNAGRIRSENNPRGIVFRNDTLLYTIECFLRWKYLFLTLLLLALWSTFNRRAIGKAYPMAMLACFALGIFLCCARLRCHKTPIMSLAYFYLPMLLVDYKSNLTKTGKALFLIVAYPMEHLAQMKTKIASFLIAGLLILVFFVAFFVKYQSHISLFGGFHQTYGAHASGHSVLVKYATEHPELLFLCESDAYRDLAYPNHTLLTPRKPYMSNVVEYGDWKALLPHRQLQREKLGIRNEALCILDDRIRFVLHRKAQIPSLIEYLRDHYGILAEFTEEHSIGEKYAVFRARIHQQK